MEQSFSFHEEKQKRYDFSSITALPGLVFLGFLIYAVSVSHTDDVTNACGSSLWVYMLVRLLLSFVGLFLMVCLGAIVSLCFDSPLALPITVSILLTVYSATMLGVGAPIITQSLNTASCVTALSNSCFTNSPMLAILGCIYIGFDALTLLGVISFACFFFFL